MSDCVLDASAVLALLQAEPGHEVVQARVEQGGCAISAVNLCEVLTRLIDWTMSAADAGVAVDALDLDVAPFDEAAARACAALRPTTRSLGLSIGDRACLALAQSRDVVALTADRAWQQLDCGIRIELIRPTP